MLDFTLTVTPDGYRWIQADPAPVDEDPGLAAIYAESCRRAEDHARAKGRTLPAPSKPVPRWMLTDGRPTLSTREWKVSRLDDHPGLWRALASLEPEREAILDFANRFGLLGVGDEVPVDGRMCYAEELRAWHREIATLRVARDLHDAILAGGKGLWNRARLFDVARLPARAPAYVQDDGQLPILFVEDNSRNATRRIALEVRVPGLFGRRLEVANERLHPELLALRPRQAPQLARAVLAALVRSRLRDLAIHAGLRWDRALTELRLTFEPDTLLGALWLQLAAAVAGGASYRACEACGQSFEVSRRSVGGRRADSAYCSDACRQRAYRQRLKRKPSKRARPSPPGSAGRRPRPSEAPRKGPRRRAR